MFCPTLPRLLRVVCSMCHVGLYCALVVMTLLARFPRASNKGVPLPSVFAFSPRVDDVRHPSRTYDQAARRSGGDFASPPPQSRTVFRPYASAAATASSSSTAADRTHGVRRLFALRAFDTRRPSGRATLPVVAPQSSRTVGDGGACRRRHRRRRSGVRPRRPIYAATQLAPHVRHFVYAVHGRRVTTAARAHPCGVVSRRYYVGVDAGHIPTCRTNKQ